jgi:O-antigen/teichoic acid export membrane protein
VDFAENDSRCPYRQGSGLIEKTVKRSIKLVFSTNVLFLAFSVATSLLSAWALGAEGRGELVVITMWLFVFTLFGTLGLPFAHRYWSARKPEWNSEIFSNTIVYTLISSFLIFAFGWIAVPYLISEQKPEVIWMTQLFLLNIPVIMFNELLRGQLEGAKLFGWLGIARISFIGTQAITYIVLYAFDLLTLINALIVIIAAQVLTCAMMFFGIWYNLRPKWRLNLNIFVKEIHYGIRSYFGILTEFAVWRLDQIMLTALASSTIIGLYAVAVAVAEISATLASSISDSLMPEVAGSDDKKRALLLLSKSLRLTLYAQLIALIPFWVSAPYVLQFVFGEEFVPATMALRLLFIASIIWSSSLILISGLNGFGNPGLSTIARIASAVTTVVTLLWLLPVWGMVGAAVSSILGYGVMLVIALVCILRTQKIGLWQFLRPRGDDISLAQIKSLFRIPITEPSKVTS